MYALFYTGSGSVLGSQFESSSTGLKIGLTAITAIIFIVDIVIAILVIVVVIVVLIKRKSKKENLKSG